VLSVANITQADLLTRRKIVPAEGLLVSEAGGIFVADLSTKTLWKTPIQSTSQQVVSVETNYVSYCSVLLPRDQEFSEFSWTIWNWRNLLFISRDRTRDNINLTVYHYPPMRHIQNGTAPHVLEPQSIRERGIWGSRWRDQLHTLQNEPGPFLSRHKKELLIGNESSNSSKESNDSIKPKLRISPDTIFHLFLLCGAYLWIVFGCGIGCGENGRPIIGLVLLLLGMAFVWHICSLMLYS